MVAPTLDVNVSTLVFALLHSVWLPGVTVSTGIAFTVTALVPVFTQPLALVPVIVYVNVLVGDAVTLAPVVAESPVPGAHV